MSFSSRIFDSQISYSEDFQSKPEFHWHATPVSFDEKHDVNRTPYCRTWLLLQPKDNRYPIGKPPKKGATGPTTTVWDPDDVDVIAVDVARGLHFMHSKRDRYIWVWVDSSLKFTVL